MNSDGNDAAADWSEALDALSFPVPGHGAICLVHRLAFKALLNGQPSKEGCLHWFGNNHQAFLAAARTKIDRLNLAFDKSLHLNSRDLRRALSGTSGEGPGRTCRFLDAAV